MFQISLLRHLLTPLLTPSNNIFLIFLKSLLQVLPILKNWIWMSSFVKTFIHGVTCKVTYITLNPIFSMDILTFTPNGLEPIQCKY